MTRQICFHEVPHSNLQAVFDSFILNIMVKIQFSLLKKEIRELKWSNSVSLQVVTTRNQGLLGGGWIPIHTCLDPKNARHHGQSELGGIYRQPRCQV